MKTRTRIFRIATVAVLLAAPAYAQQPQALTKPGAGPIVLKMGNDQGTLLKFAATWTAGKVATDQWDAPEVAAKLPAKAEPATLEFVASNGAPRTFYNWVSASFSGKNAPQAGEVVRRSATGVPQIAQFSGAVVGEVDFPAPAPGKMKQEAEFVVRAKGQWLLGAKEVKAPAPQLTKLPPAGSAMVSGYRLSVGSSQPFNIEGLEPLTLKPLQPAKITLHARAPEVEALQKLAAAQSKTKQPVGAAKGPGLVGRLELLGADGRTVFATITLHDVQIGAGGQEMLGIAQAAGAAKLAPGVVNLIATRTELAFFPGKMPLQ